MGFTKICSKVTRYANKVISCANKITRYTKYTKSSETIAPAAVLPGCLPVVLSINEYARTFLKKTKRCEYTHTQKLTEHYFVGRFFFYHVWLPLFHFCRVWCTDDFPMSCWWRIKINFSHDSLCPKSMHVTGGFSHTHLSFLLGGVGRTGLGRVDHASFLVSSWAFN